MDEFANSAPRGRNSAGAGSFLRSKFGLLLVLALAVGAAGHLLKILRDNPFPATGVPGEVVVGPNRVKLPISGLPKAGEQGLAQEAVSALWLGAAQAIHSGYCSAVASGRIAQEMTQSGLRDVPGVYFVSCSADDSNAARDYWFYKTDHGVSPCGGLSACKVGL